MARPAKVYKKTLSGKVSLYKRDNNPAWQCTFVIDNKVVRKTTKEPDYDKAVEVAAEIYTRTKILAEEGIPTVSKSFKSVADATIKRLEQALKDGNGKTTYTDYIEVINRYLIPYFGSKHVTKIDYSALKEFSDWRLQKFGHNPAKSTINTHNTALNKVFDYAVEKGYLTQSQIPSLKNDGDTGNRRPDFSIDDYRKLYRFMRKWIRQGKKGLITDKREILRDYVLFVANTGVRPGTETEGLKWSHIRTYKKDGVEYIAITVDGKTGRRELVARHNVVRPLTRLLQRQTSYKKLSLSEAIEKRLDASVFALPDGEEVKNLAVPFKILLTEGELLVDPVSGENRSLYSLRHFYVTQALLRQLPIHTVAKQCGTSVGMIERHYSHVTALLAAKELAGSKR